MTSNLITACKNEFHVQTLRTCLLLLIQSFPNPHGFETRPPSSCPEAMRGAWLSATMAIDREQGPPFPLHGLEKEGKLGCLVAGQGGVVTWVVITAAQKEEPDMDPGKLRSSHTGYRASPLCPKASNDFL